MRLYLASLFTLSLLFGMLFAVLFSLFYIVGIINVYFLIFLTLIWNFLLWLVSPRVSDFIYRYFYKLRWISLEDIRSRAPNTADKITEICENYSFPIPKLGLIPDKNPNAFTYGSGRWNARIVVTEGIFKYLDDNEISSVYAHELGHIKNRDFIIMTLASIMIQLLYEIFIISKNLSKSGSRKKGSGAIAVVAIISYVFYIIGQYILLYLSRIREYYADEFSAKHTHPNYLSSALIKIAYGILANPDNVRLVESTKTLGIMNFREAKSIGLVYYNCENLGDFEPLSKTMMFDLHNPWASLLEIGSAHPLTAKRIRRLCKLSDSPLFDFEEIERKYAIDKNRMWRNFLKDLSVLIIPYLSPILYIFLYLYIVFFMHYHLDFGEFFGTLFMLFGLLIIVKTIYRYPSKDVESSRIIDLLSDPYASPVRGKNIQLDGELVGRGIPGLVFSEDMLIRDSTGMMYLNYESWLPVLGNLIFGLKKVNRLIGKRCVTNGWFLRGISSRIDVDKMDVEGEKIRGFCKLGSLIGGVTLCVISVIVFLVL